MSYRRPTKDEGYRMVSELVTRYRPLAAELTRASSPYTETDARAGLIDGLLEALGWDVRNQAGLPQRAAEVVMERPGADAGGSWGRPDYRLRVDGMDVMPVEAKKPAVNLSLEASAAVQARSYGWSLSLPASVLTNFHETVIFDTTIAPIADDGVDVAVIPGCRFGFEEYLTRFDELWTRLSHQSLAEDGLERVYQYTRPPRGESPFDRTFLAQFREWRRAVAQDIAERNDVLGPEEVGRRTQRLLNALLFLRVCEDRDIGRYKALLDSANASGLVAAFRQADRTYNAGLFTVLDDTVVSDAVLLGVVDEMYWPRTKFAFGVLRPDILAGLYEQYLAERVVLAADRTVRLEQKPELTHAGGVVVTPEFVVEAINSATIDPFISNGVPPDFAALDLAVGSGVFLLDAYERLVAAHESSVGLLDLVERGALAQRHLFGVDIDGAAVEVTKLSLLLAVLGDARVEPARTTQALPDLGGNIVTGNAVVQQDFDRLLPAAARDPFRRAAVAPLDLSSAFGRRYPKQGFTAIVGNPPYVRIQAMAEFQPDQLDYLQASGYESASAHNFDLYMVFLERALGLLADGGRLGYITPHRFTNHASASALRIKLGERIERLIHFGEEQVFPGRTTYVAILVVGPKTRDAAVLEQVSDWRAWAGGSVGDVSVMERSSLGGAVWPIASADQSALFAQLKAGGIAKLGDPDWVKVFVGVQTSADKLFFVRPHAGFSDSGELVTIVDVDGSVHPIERELLRPALLDQSIAMFDGQPEPDKLAIFPYRIEERPDGERRALVLTPEEMRSYPHALAYFELHKERLARRSITPNPGEAYWAYGRSQSLTQLDEPKLVVRGMTLTPRYARDDEGMVVAGGGDGGPYYLLRPLPGCPYSMEVIQALLSHPAVDAFVASMKRYRNGYASHRKAFLVEVPVPALSVGDQVQIEERVLELRRLSIRLRSETDTAISRSLNARREFLMGEVEGIISRSYGLEEDLLARALGTS